MKMIKVYISVQDVLRTSAYLLFCIPLAKALFKAE